METDASSHRNKELPARTCLQDSRRGNSFSGSERSSRRGSRLCILPWGLPRSQSSPHSRRKGRAAAPQAIGGRPVPGLGQIQIRWRRMFRPIGSRPLPARTCLGDSRQGHSSSGLRGHRDAAHDCASSPGACPAVSLRYALDRQAARPHLRLTTVALFRG